MITADKLTATGFPPEQAKVLAAQIPNSQPAMQAITAIATADATDLGTAIALANATKAKVNAILAQLKA